MQPTGCEIGADLNRLLPHSVQNLAELPNEIIKVILCSASKTQSLIRTSKYFLSLNGDVHETSLLSFPVRKLGLTGKEAIDKFCKLGKEVRKVDLKRCVGIDNEDLKKLAAACPNIEELYLSSSLAYDDEGLKAFSQSSKLKILIISRHLTSKCQLTGSFLIGSENSFPALQELDLKAVDTLTPTALQTIFSSPKLIKVKVNNLKDLELLIDKKKWPKLESLTIYSSSEEQIEILAQLIFESRDTLKEVAISSFFLRQPCIREALAQCSLMEKFTIVGYLQLDLSHLNAIISNKEKLHYLDLREAKIKHHELEAWLISKNLLAKNIVQILDLPTASGFPHLKEIKLPPFFSDMEGIQEVYENEMEPDSQNLDSFGRLRSISLRNTTDVTKIDGTRLKKLNSVSLQGAPITDQFLAILAKNATDLERVDLSNCFLITHIGLQALQQGCKGLAFVNIHGCSAIDLNLLPEFPENVLHH